MQDPTKAGSNLQLLGATAEEIGDRRRTTEPKRAGGRQVLTAAATTTTLEPRQVDGDLKRLVLPLEIGPLPLVSPLRHVHRRAINLGQTWLKALVTTLARLPLPPLLPLCPCKDNLILSVIPLAFRVGRTGVRKLPRRLGQRNAVL